MQKPHPHDVAVEITRPVHHKSLDRSISAAFKGWTRADIRHAATPLAFDESRGHVDAVAGNHAILRMKIRGWKSQCHAAFGAAHDATFDSVRPAQHPARKIHASLLQQFANST